MRNGEPELFNKGGDRRGYSAQMLCCYSARCCAGLFRQMLGEEINRHDIAVRTRTGNHRSSLRRHKRMMTELLTTMHIRQMHLNHRKLSRLQRIM